MLMDGSEHEVDTVIMCTGYRPVLDYLDIDYETDRDGWMLRSDPRGTEIAGYPGLFLVGRYYRGLGTALQHPARGARRRRCDCGAAARRGKQLARAGVD